MRQIVTLLGFFFVVNTSFTQIISFERFFTTYSGNSILQTLDSGYVVTGYHEYPEIINLIKLDKNGDIQFARDICEGEAYSVIQCNDTGYIIAGRKYFNGSSRTFAFKTNSIGDTVWTIFFNDSQISDIWQVKQTSDNYYIFIGRKKIGINYKTMVLKVNNNGIIIWTKILSSPQDFDEQGRCLSIKQNNNILVAGQFNNSHAFICELNSEGDSIWHKTYPIGIGGVNSILNSGDGFIYASIGSEGSAIIMKTNLTGDIIWTKYYNNTMQFLYQSNSIDFQNNGIIIGGGSSNSFPSNWDLVLFKINFNGDTLWTRRFINGQYADQIKATNDGGIILIANNHILKLDSIGISHLSSIQNDLIRTKSYPVRVCPNPFCETTRFDFDIPISMVNIYNTDGTIVDTYLTDKKSSIIFNKEKLSKGLYYYKAKSADKNEYCGKLIIY